MNLFAGLSWGLVCPKADFGCALFGDDLTPI